ncbi:hypothetical protein ROZALSC1DRAFT_31518 [Rozella allomycis CSF55]|uniref:Uncharacterized protein n=1 Tax=Rozella allomycis (strain CSF55) TaxID=988480 RepID=A0A4P9YBU9_ROZAC|nr:hypothetical protein ROZALSC1DRAFT_31518 [Rozella allomycis CSF55]
MHSLKISLIGLSLLFSCILTVPFDYRGRGSLTSPLRLFDRDTYRTFDNEWDDGYQSDRESEALTPPRNTPQTESTEASEVEWMPEPPTGERTLAASLESLIRSNNVLQSYLEAHGLEDFPRRMAASIYDLTRRQGVHPMLAIVEFFANSGFVYLVTLCTVSSFSLLSSVGAFNAVAAVRGTSDFAGASYNGAVAAGAALGSRTVAHSLSRLVTFYSKELIEKLPLKTRVVFSQAFDLLTQIGAAVSTGVAVDYNRLLFLTFFSFLYESSVKAATFSMSSEGWQRMIRMLLTSAFISTTLAFTLNEDVLSTLIMSLLGLGASAPIYSSL